MATVSITTGTPSPRAQSDETLSTLPDPRTPLTPPELSRSNSASSHHPELSNEVATLSNKLIHAINYQTDLDDHLSDTRNQLEAAQERIKRLERVEQEYRSSVENGILVKWADVENDTLRLQISLAEERKQRVQVEKDKESIEHELETLTTALFEEANQMVSAARKEARKNKEAIERRNEQLQAQLNDAELLLASHQEQLAELKQAMQDMSAQQNDAETAANSPTAPSTPALETPEDMNKLFDALHLSPTTPGGEIITPTPPTSLTHLIMPILRTDVQAYEDFHALLDVSRRSDPPSRVASGTYGALGGLGLTNLNKTDQSQISTRIPSNHSTSSLSASNTYQSPPGTPNKPLSTIASISSRDIPHNGMPLKETPFYKRVLVEDIEPTLRLDAAPGLSWLARRSVVSSMCEGRLIVEPVPPTAKTYHPPCSLCGEQGRSERRSRTHRFRTSNSDTAQRYPVCQYCLNRVRSTCDFLGFLRMIKDGHWKTDGPHAEATAWEQSVRLRERMFWSRIGGGVIPAFIRTKPELPRISTEITKTRQPFPSSQTSLISKGSKPEQPSLSIQKVENEHPTLSIREPEPQQSPPDMQITMPKPPLPSVEPKTSRNHHPPVEIDSITQPMAGESDRGQHLTSAERQPHSQTNSNRSPLRRTKSRSRGSSRTEGSGRTINSIAKRAAMFEHKASDDAASN